MARLIAFHFLGDGCITGTATMWDSGLMEELGGLEEWRRGWQGYDYHRDHALMKRASGMLPVLPADDACQEALPRQDLLENRLRRSATRSYWRRSEKSWVGAPCGAPGPAARAFSPSKQKLTLRSNAIIAMAPSESFGSILRSSSTNDAVA